MKKFWIILLITGLVGCVSNNQTPPEKEVIETPEPSQESEPSSLGYVVLTDQLVEPWSIKELPDGRFIIAEKAGALKLFSFETGLSEIQFDPTMIDASGQGGLLDVLVDPQFEDNHTIYLVYSSGYTNLSKAQLSSDLSAVVNHEILYEALPQIASSNHYGGRVVMDEARNLYLSTGDRQIMGNRMASQDDQSGHGKVIKIDLQGNSEVYAKGFRNPQGLAFNPQGDLYLSDMGPKGGDEINLVEAGHNYGWPLVSYGTEYSGEPVGEGLQTMEGITDPLYTWNPSVAPSGITFYTSNVISEFENRLLVSSLVQRHLIALKIENNVIVDEVKYLEDFGQRIRDVIEVSDGSVLIISDEGSLVHLRLE